MRKAFASLTFVSRLCLAIASTVSIAALAGCGGGSPSGNTGGKTTTTVTSVTVSPATKTITAGDSISFTATVAGDYNPSQVVNWSVSPASAGTISAAGAFASASTITTATTATITAASTVPGYTNFTGTATVTINPAPVTVTSVTNVATPSSITTAQTATCLGTVHYSDGTTSNKVGYTATNGTITTAGVFTPAAVGSASCTATSTEDATKSDTETIAVTAVPLPNVTSISPSTIFADGSLIEMINLQLHGNGFASGQFIDFNIPESAMVTGLTATQINFQLSLDTPHFSPGFITATVCENANGTNCGTSGTVAFLGAQNYCAASASGEIFCLDQAQGLFSTSAQNGYVRKYKADGTADGSFLVGAHKSIAVDDKTGNVLVDGGDFDENGAQTVPGVASAPAGAVSGNAADNGYGCVAQPSNNSASCYDLVGGNIIVPLATATGLGNHPESIAMGTFGVETDAFVVSVDGTPSLYKVRASDAYTGEEPALALPGITPMSSLPNVVTGGWQVVVFDSGSASGTAAVLSTYDHLLVLVNTSTWTVTKSVSLSGTPFRIATDVANGRIIVAYANPANATTTYDAVDALSGVVTPLSSTSSLLSVGLVVSSDGTKIYSSQRNQLEVK